LPYATGSTGLALTVRGSSRRIMIMRFRPANIRLINRRSSLPRLLLALSSWRGKNKCKNNPTESAELTRSLHIRAMRSLSELAICRRLRFCRVTSCLPTEGRNDLIFPLSRLKGEATPDASSEGPSRLLHRSKRSRAQLCQALVSGEFHYLQGQGCRLITLHSLKWK